MTEFEKPRLSYSSGLLTTSSRSRHTLTYGLALKRIDVSVKLIQVIALALSWLPLRTNQFLGALLGRLVWTFGSKPRLITETNLRLCYPHVNGREFRDLVRHSLIETGKQLTECAWIWHRPVLQTQKLIMVGQGQALLDEARKSAMGLIMVTPHIGNWELCLLPLSRQHPLTYFYKSPKIAGLDSVIVNWRAHLGGQAATLDAAGIRGALKVLKAGGTLGILPDQEPEAGGGIFAPFFNEPALTMTLLSKIANRSGATVLFCVAERLARGKGWRFHVLPAEPAVSSDVLIDATAALNRGVEQCISLCPAQYLWDYRRFHAKADGTRRQYS
jgi:KDO2-lipid IV(A) lauroyltransferase